MPRQRLPAGLLAVTCAAPLHLGRRRGRSRGGRPPPRGAAGAGVGRQQGARRPGEGLRISAHAQTLWLSPRVLPERQGQQGPHITTHPAAPTRHTRGCASPSLPWLLLISGGMQAPAAAAHRQRARGGSKAAWRGDTAPEAVGTARGQSPTKTHPARSVRSRGGLKHGLLLLGGGKPCALASTFVYMAAPHWIHPAC